MPGVQGILLVGKAAMLPIEKFDSLRDVDFIVIHKNQSAFERHIYEHDAIMIDLSYISLNDLERVIHEENAMWIGFLNHSKVLWIGDQTTKLLTSLLTDVKERYDRGPKPLSTEDIQWIRFQIGSYLEEIENRKNENAFLLEDALWRYYRFVIEQAYALHGKWLPKEKRQLEGLADINYDLYRGLIDWIESDVHMKSEKSKVISKILLKHIGEPMVNYPRGIFPLLK